MYTDIACGHPGTLDAAVRLTDQCYGHPNIYVSTRPMDHARLDPEGFRISPPKIVQVLTATHIYIYILLIFDNIK